MKNKAFHFNFVDVLIGCITILIIAVLFSIFVLGNSNYDLFRRDSVQITLTVEKIPYVQNDKILRNDKVYLIDSNDEFGNVKSVVYSHTPHISESTGAVDYYYPEYLNAEIVIECKASAGENSVDINGKQYSVSDSVSFYVPGFSGTGTITSFEVIE